MKNTKAKSRVKTSRAKKSSFLAKFKSLPLAAKGLIIMVVLFGVAGLGTYGFIKYKENDLKAQAANWGAIYARDNHVAWACKNRINSEYSEVVVAFGRPARGGASVGYITTYDRNKNYTGQQSNGGWYGQIGYARSWIKSDGWYSVRTNKSSASQTISILFTPWCSGGGGK